MQKDEAVKYLHYLIQSSQALPSMKGKSALISKIKASMRFIGDYRIDGKNLRLIIDERQKDFDAVFNRSRPQQQKPLNL